MEKEKPTANKTANEIAREAIYGHKPTELTDSILKELDDIVAKADEKSYQ